MNLIKSAVFFAFLFQNSAIIASDCSVGYAHMQNGDYKRAYSEFRTLAERGYPVYMNIIADMHLKGQGVQSDQVVAHVWYSLSAAQGNPRGIESKTDLTQQLNTEQLKQSRELSQSYAKVYLEPYKVGWSLN